MLRVADGVPDHLIVVERFSPASRFERVLVICDCPVGQSYARNWTGMPDEANGLSLDTLFSLDDQEQALNAALDFVDKPRGWVSFAGRFGNGKTTLIYAALNDLAAQGVYGRYFSAPEMLDYLREAFDRGCQDSALTRLQAISELPVLAIDELDKYNATAWAGEQMQKLFDLRYRNRRLVGTLIGYNLQYAENIPGFLRSRMSDGRFKLIEMLGPDIRPALEPEWDERDVWQKNP